MAQVWNYTSALTHMGTCLSIAANAAAEKKGAQMLLFTFMIAAGALTGEAFYGVESAILAVIDESFGDSSWWPYARLSGFLLFNVLLGAMIYVLFRKSGILGRTGTEPPTGGNRTKVMDAELAD